MQRADSYAKSMRRKVGGTDEHASDQADGSDATGPKQPLRLAGLNVESLERFDSDSHDSGDESPKMARRWRPSIAKPVQIDASLLPKVPSAANKPVIPSSRSIPKDRPVPQILVSDDAAETQAAKALSKEFPERRPSRDKWKQSAVPGAPDDPSSEEWERWRSEVLNWVAMPGPVDSASAVSATHPSDPAPPLPPPPTSATVSSPSKPAQAHAVSIQEKRAQRALVKSQVLEDGDHTRPPTLPPAPSSPLAAYAEASQTRPKSLVEARQYDSANESLAASKPSPRTSASGKASRQLRQPGSLASVLTDDDSETEEQHHGVDPDDDTGRYSPDLDPSHLSGSILDLLASHRQSSVTSAGDFAADKPPDARSPKLREAGSPLKPNHPRMLSDTTTLSAGHMEPETRQSEMQDAGSPAFKRNAKMALSFKANKSRFEVCLADQGCFIVHMLQTTASTTL